MSTTLATASTGSLRKAVFNRGEMGFILKDRFRSGLLFITAQRLSSHLC